MTLPWSVLLSCSLGNTPSSVAADSRTELTPPPLPAAPTYNVPAVGGPPSLSCKEAIAIARDRKPDPPSRSSSSSSSSSGSSKKLLPLPDLDAMEEVDIINHPSPGSVLSIDPLTVPLQFIEGSREARRELGEVMLSAANGLPVRITVLGDSHTSDDWWTGEIRRILQKRYGDRGHGFVLPASLYRGYRGHDVNLCSEGWSSHWAGRGEDDLLGLGIAVSSDDPDEFGWMETTHSNERGRAVSRYEVLTLMQQGGGGLRLQVDEEDPVLISTQALSPGLQHTRLQVPDGAHRLTLNPVGDGPVRVLGVSLERDHPGFLVDAIGLRGQQARAWLRWDLSLASQTLKALQPSLVVLAFGTNEANDESYSREEVLADYLRILGDVRRSVPDAACLIVGPPDRAERLDRSRYSIWERTSLVAEAQQQAAWDLGCTFWDWQEAMGGPGSMITWSLQKPALGARDLTHLTAAGYRLSAELLTDALEASRDPEPLILH